MKALESALNWLVHGSGLTVWITGVTIILCVTALLHLCWGAVHRRVHRHLARTTTVWDDAVWDALKRPLSVAIWILGFGLSLEHAFGDRTPLVVKVIDTGRSIGLVLLIGWFLLRLVRAGVLRLNEQARASEAETRLDATTIDAIGKLLRISVVVVMALVLLQTLGFSISGVLAFGGIGGLAVSFAAKDLLANFFGGLVIYLDRPFAVGDCVRSPDRQMEGTVEYIGWRHTRVRTTDKRALYLPNAIFTTIAVENISRQSHRRIKETLGLRYQDAERVPAIVADLQALLSRHEGLAQAEGPEVHLEAFAESAIQLQITAHTRSTDAARFRAIKQDLMLQVLNILHAHGAQLAFPTRQIVQDSPVAARAAE